jgi:rhombotail lipoprotein
VRARRPAHRHRSRKNSAATPIGKAGGRITRNVSVAASTINGATLNGIEPTAETTNSRDRMNSPRVSRSLPLYLGLFFLGLLLTGGCMGPRQTRHASSVVSYLYPGQKTPLAPTSIPVLRLPLRVGIAFVPAGSGAQANYFGVDGISEMQKSALLQRVAGEFKGREYIESIEIIPSTYLRPGGGFDNLDQVRGLLNVDVVALVAYDQVQFTNENLLSLSYWTIVGAYIFHGNKNETHTLMEAAVYDIPSRHLLFRAPGGSQVQANAAGMYVQEKLREDRAKGFDAATIELTANLKSQLEEFRERIKRAPGEVTLEHKPGYTGGGPFGGMFVGLLATLGLARAIWRRTFCGSLDRLA